jgi:tyrosine-protein phosphatase YwqE
MPWPFKRSKQGPSFAECAADGLYDTHGHFLPGCDDGARNMDETVTMLDGLASLGYVRVTATTHFSTDSMIPDLKTQTALIEEISHKRGGAKPEVLTGAEILFDNVFVSREEEGKLPRIGTGRTYLVEFGFHLGGLPPGIEEMVFRIQARGITLVLAHPERYIEFYRDPARLETLHQAGMLLQMDLLSLAGEHGPEIEKLAESFLAKGIIDLAASDLHRPNQLESLEKALEKLVGWDKDEFVRLASVNPRYVLEGFPDEVIRNA